MQAPGANQNCARSLGGNGGLDTSGKIGKSFVWVVRVWDERVPRHRPLQPSPLPTTPPPRIAAPPHPSHRDVKYNCTQKTTSSHSVDGGLECGGWGGMPSCARWVKSFF